MRFRRVKEPSEATQALKEARENLKRTQARSPEVREVSRALRILREKNHFSEQLRTIMMGGS